MAKGKPMTSFRDLHQPGNPFILANAWDKGSAQVLAALGAKAIGTSSAAHAFTLGKPDMGHVTRDEALTHAQDLIAATSLPVSGDFENGFGHDPDTCAETVRLSGEIGLAGICIEDAALPDTKPYDFELAVERIKAAASAAKNTPKDFFLIARADGVMNGVYDMKEAIRRIQAFDKAGADGLYVPLPPNMDALKDIVNATSKPINVLAAGTFTQNSYSEFAKAGVARISLGAALARATHKTLLDAAKNMLNNGDFSHLGGISGDTIDALLEKGAQP